MGHRVPDRRGIVRCAGALFIALIGFAHGVWGAADGLQRDVVFAVYPRLANNSELVRRLWSPLAKAQARQLLAASGKVLYEEPINLSDERFVVYVPSQAPPDGYALLVFVPPWQDARLPKGWASVLDHYGVIFVSAARSGNDENLLGRREPLALIAAQNIISRYPVNPERVYIAGFSGGARVAVRLALGYSDVFRGALLNAGSDPIGDAQIPLPPKELVHEFQMSTRLIYVTGEEDDANLGLAAESMQSMQDWCVFDVHAFVTPRSGHELASSAVLSRALGALLNPVSPDPDRLAACRSAIDRDLATKLQQAEALIASGQHDESQRLLIEIDRHFGGLAAPRSVALWSVLN